MKYLKQYAILAILIICASFSQTLSLKADIGVCACWDSVSLNLSQLTGIKVGTYSVIGNLIAVGIQKIVLKDKFPFVKYLQIPVAVLFGIVINFVYYHVLTFEIHSYYVRVILWLLSNIGLAIFIGAITLMNKITMPVEGTCYILSNHYHMDFAKLRIGVDVVCIVTSILLSIVFGLSLKIREGTVLGMIILGPMMSKCMKFEKRFKFLFDSDENKK